MLIEFHMRSFSTKEVIDVLYELQLKGIVPIIAHPERYSYIQKNPNKLLELIENGVL